MKQEQLEIIRRVQAGEPGSFEELYREYYHVVYYFALKNCKSEADAKDVTQETFLCVGRFINNLRSIEAFQTWLYRIVLSQCNTLYRKRKDMYLDEETLQSFQREEERNEFVPHKHFAQASDQEIVKALINELSQKRSEVLYKFYFQQLSLEEVANDLGISVGTVKTRLFEGRKALKEKIVAFEQTEGRKITFRLPGFSTIFMLSFISYFQKIMSKQKYVQVLQVSSIAIALTTASTAIVKTSEIIQNPKPQQEQAKPVITRNEFSSTSYRNQEITSNKEAYFALLDFAPEASLLKTKEKQELLEIEPLVSSFLQYDNAYRTQLESNGWLSTYQSLR